MWLRIGVLLDARHLQAMEDTVYRVGNTLSTQMSSRPERIAVDLEEGSEGRSEPPSVAVLILRANQR